MLSSLDQPLKRLMHFIRAKAGANKGVNLRSYFRTFAGSKTRKSLCRQLFALSSPRSLAAAGIAEDVIVDIRHNAIAADLSGHFALHECARRNRHGRLTDVPAQALFRRPATALPSRYGLPPAGYNGSCTDVSETRFLAFYPAKVW